MTVTQTIDTASMLQSYRQIQATKEVENFGITLDSLEPAQESDSVKALDLQHEIAQMKAAWLMDSSLTIGSSPDGDLLAMSKSLWDFFDYKQAGFRNSIVVRVADEILNSDEMIQKEFGLLKQNPRYADAREYRYETNVYEADNGTLTVKSFKSEYNVQISVFHSPSNVEIYFEDYGYTRNDFNESAKTIEDLLDSVLEEQFQNNPDSQQTNILLLLKARLQAMPEIIEQIRANATDYTRKAIDEGNEEALLLAIYTADLEIASELSIFHDISIQLAQYLSPEQQQQIANAKEVIINYYQNNWNKDFAFKGLDPIMQFMLTNAAKTLAENMKNVAIDDETETLLDLGAEKRANYASIMDEEIARESVLNRAKKPTSDDSILQKIMKKMSNTPKATGMSS
ncbi:MAG: hypothetical protein HDT12_04970 [Helicobacter sp.]|nr:hypothetical protein [Helicobacter sp.]